MFSAPGGSLIAPLAAALVAEAAGRGVPRDQLIEALALTEQALVDAERRVEIGHVLTTWELAMRRTRDAGLPVSVGKLASVARFGLLGYTLYTRPTLGDALASFSRFHDLINDSGRWAIDPAEDAFVVTWSRPGPRSLGMRVANEQALASFVTFADAMAGGPITVLEVRFAHPAPVDVSAHEAHFRAPLVWGAPSDALVIASAPMSRAPLGADPVTSAYFTQAVEVALARVAEPSSFAGQVARKVSDALGSGIPTLAAIAAAFGTSERTARRRLASEGTSFDALLADVQRERAESLLASGTPVREVAFALGFSDATAFSRAYRRWTGRPPSASRRAAR